MAGALPAEEYKSKLERAGFHDVNITLTKPHVLDMDVGLSADDLAAIGGVASDALITALR